jgi:hypothetical protein
VWENQYQSRTVESLDPDIVNLPQRLQHRHQTLSVLRPARLSGPDNNCRLKSNPLELPLEHFSCVALCVCTVHKSRNPQPAHSSDPHRHIFPQYPVPHIIPAFEGLLRPTSPRTRTSTANKLRVVCCECVSQDGDIFIKRLFSLPL